MTFAITIAIIIFVLGFIVFGIILLVKFLGRKGLKYNLNANVVWNYTSKGGFMTGREVHVSESNDGKRILEIVAPTDYYKATGSDEKEEVPDYQRIVLRKEDRKVIPPGPHSNISHVLLLHKDLSRVMDKIPSSSLSQFLALFISEENKKIQIIENQDLMAEGIRAKAKEIFSKGGEMTDMQLNKTVEMLEKMLIGIGKKKED